MSYLKVLEQFASEEKSAGLLTLRNEGAFIALFSVSFDLGGQRHTRTSPDILPGGSYSIEVPSGATNILMNNQIVTWPWPRTTRTVCIHEFENPLVKCYKVYGTVFDPHCAEVPCS